MKIRFLLQFFIEKLTLPPTWKNWYHISSFFSFSFILLESPIYIAYQTTFMEYKMQLNVPYSHCNINKSGHFSLYLLWISPETSVSTPETLKHAHRISNNLKQLIHTSYVMSWEAFQPCPVTPWIRPIASWQTFQRLVPWTVLWSRPRQVTNVHVPMSPHR